MLAVAAIEGIKYVETHPDALVRLRENASVMRNALRKTVQQITIPGAEESPILHLQLKGQRFRNRDGEEQTLQEAVDEAIRNGVLVTRAKYVNDQELHRPTPSIRITVSAAHSRKEVEKAATVVGNAIKKALKARK